MTTIDLSTWRITRDQIEVVSNSAEYAALNSQSVPVSGLRGDSAGNVAANGSAVVQLPLFGVAMHTFVTAEHSDYNRGHKRKSDDQAPSAGGRRGAVLYAGGPVWALDWTALIQSQDADGKERAAQYLADPGTAQVAAHPRGRTENVIGKPLAGPGCVQIWEVQLNRDGCAIAGRPRMALGLCHDGGVAYDVKWCPLETHSAAGTDGGLPRVGLLAVVLGSGQVQLLCVPQPSALGADQQGGSAGSEALFVRLPDVVLLPERVGGSGASTVEWLPRSPHDLLLVGHWDGTTSLWRLVADSSAQPGSPPFVPELQLHVRTDEGPVRCVAWAPPDLTDGGDAGAERSVFCTAGGGMALSVWDARDMFHPVFHAWLGCQAHTLDWGQGRLPALLALDSGLLSAALLAPVPARRQMGSGTVTALFWNPAGAMWAVHSCGATRQLAHGSQEGGVWLSEHAHLHDRRHRSSHTAVFGWQVNDGVLSPIGQQKLRKCTEAMPGAPVNPTKMKKKDAQAAASVVLNPGPYPPHPLLAVHRVRWSKADSSGAGAGWLAHGGAAGLICLQRLPGS